MTGVWSWVILVIVLGLVSTFEIGVIASLVGKIVESKMRTYYEMEIKTYNAAMDRLDATLNKFIELAKETLVKI